MRVGGRHDRAMSTGIRVRMITGDDAMIVAATAAEPDLEGRAVTSIALSLVVVEEVVKLRVRRSV